MIFFIIPLFFCQLLETYWYSCPFSINYLFIYISMDTYFIVQCIPIITYYDGKIAQDWAVHSLVPVSNMTL